VDLERHRRAQTLFEQAEALPLEKRETLLETIGADDAMLRREVTRLLEAAASMAEDFLEPCPRSLATRITVGETLAHYRILEQLGVGGMGEVYLAEDERLRRRVALKVLPPDLAGSPERLERFQREAETVAALNHPNIVTIYSIEHEGGVHFLTMELVEGPTLRRLIDHSGALPIEDVLDWGAQIAEGVAEAHAAGIIHRDLKPGNVMVTPDGKVKVLDFGLAKAWSGAGEACSTELSHSPRLTDDRTAAGTILGTTGYMSPEQARGKPVDKRADVWSFGVLLGEMLTGRSLFSGDIATDVLVAVLTKEPNLEALPAATPEGVRRLLGRCLRKDPRARWPDMGAARLVLQDALAGTGTGAEAPTAGGQETRAARRRRTVERWVWAAVVLALAGVASLRFLSRPTEAPEARPTAHFVFDAPEGLTLADFDPLAISPDGRSIVFAGRTPTGAARLWIRRLDALDLRELPGTEGGGRPFWSPDGASIGFFAEGELKKVSLASGTVHKICALPPESLDPAGTWGSEGTIVFSKGGLSGLYAVSAAGGAATPLTRPEWRTNHWWPNFLPDGRRFLFEIFGTHAETAGVYAENAGVYLGSLDAPDEGRRLLPVPMRTKYGSGHLLFVQDGSTLLAQPFDLARAELTGDPVAVASPVATGMFPVWGWFSVSATGVLAYVEGTAADVQLVWLDRAGKQLGTLGDPGRFTRTALSPDGRRVAAVVMAGAGVSDIWVIDVDRGMRSRATTGPRASWNPVWSPDGRELVFSRADRDNLGASLYRKELRVDATESALREPAGRGIAEDWSHDGKTLLYRTRGKENALWALPMEGDGPPELVLKSAFSVGLGQLSSDGRWLVYVSDESGQYEVYVEPFRRPGERVRVSPDGISLDRGGRPRWRGDGKELFYLSRDGQLMVVDVREAAAGLEVGTPEVLIPADALGAAGGFDAVTADGQRFLVRMRVDEDPQRIHVVTNWSSLLE
jgi:eukaryotic-like serine/threonine-protein kinase